MLVLSLFFILFFIFVLQFHDNWFPDCFLHGILHFMLLRRFVVLIHVNIIQQ